MSLQRCLRVDKYTPPEVATEQYPGGGWWRWGGGWWDGRRLMGMERACGMGRRLVEMGGGWWGGGGGQ